MGSDVWALPFCGFRGLVLRFRGLGFRGVRVERLGCGRFGLQALLLKIVLYGSIEDVRSAHGCGSEQQAMKKKLPNTLCKPS